MKRARPWKVWPKDEEDVCRVLMRKQKMRASLVVNVVVDLCSVTGSRLTGSRQEASHVARNEGGGGLGSGDQIGLTWL